MELEFKEKSFSYLEQVLYMTANQEETGETIVPDSYPDIETIIDSYAEAIVRGKDCRAGSITISGGVKGGLIYLPEDSSAPKTLDFYLPFSIRVDDPSLTEQTKIICIPTIRSVDARMINSRKALLRTNLCCIVKGFNEYNDRLYSLETCPEKMQLKKQTYLLELPLEISEKSFTISDIIETISETTIAQLYKISCAPRITDKKLVANKGVFKGICRVKLLYISDNQRMYALEQELPFSQYCEFLTDFDDDKLDVTPVITGYDTEIEENDGNCRLRISINVLAQGIVRGSREYTTIEDAYCTQDTFVPEWQHYSMENVLDMQSEHKNTYLRMPGNISEVINIDLYPDYPADQKIGDNIKLTLPISVHLLGIDDHGMIAALTGKTEICHETALCDTARYESIVQSGNCSSSLFADGPEVQFELWWDIVFCASQKMRTICGGTFEICTDDSRRPSVVIKSVKKGTDIWEIAKTNRAKVSAIQSANHLKDGIICEDQIILIPVG